MPDETPLHNAAEALQAADDLLSRTGTEAELLRQAEPLLERLGKVLAALDRPQIRRARRADDIGQCKRDLRTHQQALQAAVLEYPNNPAIVMRDMVGYGVLPRLKWTIHALQGMLPRVALEDQPSAPPMPDHKRRGRKPTGKAQKDNLARWFEANLQPGEALSERKLRDRLDADPAAPDNLRNKASLRVALEGACSDHPDMVSRIHDPSSTGILYSRPMPNGSNPATARRQENT